MEQSVILFDGICNLCCGWVSFLIKQDRKELFLFAPLQSERAEKLLKPFGVDAKEAKTIFYIKDKHCLCESEAVLLILYDLGGIWKLTTVFLLIPKFIRDFIYRLIVSGRYKLFGKKTTCMLSIPKNEKRFLF